MSHIVHYSLFPFQFVLNGSHYYNISLIKNLPFLYLSSRFTKRFLASSILMMRRLLNQLSEFVICFLDIHIHSQHGFSVSSSMTTSTRKYVLQHHIHFSSLIFFVETKFISILAQILFVRQIILNIKA